MAVTKGHGNPKWTREEVILALELYHSAGGSIPGPNDGRVIALSAELRSLPYHSVESKKPSFRNSDGVAFKLQNIRSVATGRGLGNTSKMDKAVWATFGGDKVATAAAAARIRQGIEIVRLVERHDIEHEFSEGRAVTEAHSKIERDNSIRRKLLKLRKSTNSLYCDICGCAGEVLDDSIRDSLFEAHHTIPLSGSGEVKTKLNDISLLCANCHRLIHRLMNREKRWVGLHEAKKELGYDS